MKKIIILKMLLAIAAASFGQQNTTDQHWKESDYYKKSKKQDGYKKKNTGDLYIKRYAGYHK